MPTTERPAYCADCIKGFSWTGIPTGAMRKMGAFDTVYVAPGGGATEDTPAVVLLTDVFGFGLENPKILADTIAAGTGFAVYVPDLFFGQPLSPDGLVLPETPAAEAATGVLAKVMNWLAIAGKIPWLLMNRSTVKTPAVVGLVDILRNELGHTKIGAVGYSYGAALAASLDKAGATVASAYVHPSMVSKADIALLINPSTFAVAESDAFDAPMLAYVREILQGKVPLEVVSYAGTCHGFAARGDLRIDSVREGCEGALVQVVNWFRTHLA